MGRPSDIIVVGAGIVGCAVAHELASRGASVEIVDERPVGMGATQASADREGRIVQGTRRRGPVVGCRQPDVAGRQNGVAIQGPCRHDDGLCSVADGTIGSGAGISAAFSS